MFVLLEIILRSSKDNSTTLQAMHLLTHLTHPSRYQLAAAGQDPTMAANLPMLGAVVSSSKAYKAAGFSFAQWCMATKLQLELALNIFKLVTSGESAAAAVAPQTAPAASPERHHLWAVVSAVISAGLHVGHSACSTLAAIFDVLPLVFQLQMQYPTPAAVAAAAAVGVIKPSEAAAGKAGTEGCCPRPSGSLAALVKQLLHFPGAGGCDQQPCNCWGSAGSNQGKLLTKTIPSSQAHIGSSSSSSNTTISSGSGSSSSLNESRGQVGSLDLGWLAGVMDLLGSSAVLEVARVVGTERKGGHLEGVQQQQQQQQQASTALACQQDLAGGGELVGTEGVCGRQGGLERQQQQVCGPLGCKQDLRDWNGPLDRKLQQLCNQVGLMQAMEEAAGRGAGEAGAPLVQCIDALHDSIRKVFGGPVATAVPLLRAGLGLCKQELDRETQQAAVFRASMEIGRTCAMTATPTADAFAIAALGTFAAQLSCRLCAGFCCNALGCSNLEGWSEMGQVLGHEGAGNCGGCGGPVYCSKACQEQDWREGHQGICPSLRR